jgi:DNA integrity scanning protein DisA with diadenylate cyclase activity
VVDCFGEIGALQRATVADIGAVPGIDLAQAASIKETLDRRTESAILDHYA